MAKFCANCGSELNENQDICLKCGMQVKGNTAKVEEEKKTSYCANCGSELKPGQDICLKCGVKVNKTSANGEGKSKIAAGLLGIFLGVFGVHNFYLGYTGKAVAQLLITLLSCFILSPVSAIWGLIEGIMILTGSINTDADGNELTE